MKLMALFFFVALIAGCSRSPSSTNSSASSSETAGPAASPAANETVIPRNAQEGYTRMLRLLVAQQIHRFGFNLVQFRTEEATKLLPERDKASVAELIPALRTAAGSCETRTAEHRIPSSVEQFIGGAQCRYAMETVWFQDPALRSSYEWKSDDQTVVALAGVTRIKSTIAERQMNGARRGYLRTETGEMTFADGAEGVFYFEYAGFQEGGEHHRTTTLALNIAGSPVEIRLGYGGGPTVNGIPADRVVPLW